MDKSEKLALANDVFIKLCNVIEGLDWTYNKFEEDLSVGFDVSGDDLPMRIIIIINPDKMLVSLYSPMPFEFRKEKRVDGAIAVCAANYGLADGFFKYDITDGKIMFKLTSSFCDSDIAEDLLEYVIHYSISVIDEYNDQFLAINKGYLDLDSFVANH